MKILYECKIGENDLNKYLKSSDLRTAQIYLLQVLVSSSHRTSL